VSVHKRRFHRRDANIAEKSANENNETRCVLCAFAVSLFIYQRTLIQMFNWLRNHTEKHGITTDDFHVFPVLPGLFFMHLALVSGLFNSERIYASENPG
jgi:hypothetical protein